MTASRNVDSRNVPRCKCKTCPFIINTIPVPLLWITAPVACKRPTVQGGCVDRHTAAILLASSLLAFAGCDRHTPAALAASRSSSSSADSTLALLDDGRPQTGLPRLSLYLGAKELNAELAMTAAAIQKGLMWRTNVPETEGMLFVFARPHQTAFWMKNVPIEIDVAYLDPEGAILEIHKMNRQDTNPVPAKTASVQYALETAVGWFQRNGIGTGTVVRTDRGSLHDTFVRNP